MATLEAISGHFRRPLVILCMQLLRPLSAHTADALLLPLDHMLHLAGH